MQVTACFAFLQSAHYLTWLYVIPQEELSGEGTLTFRMSARSLRRDFGDAGVALLVVVGGVLAAAAFALLRTRAVYLSLASFHGYLELAMWAYLGTRRPAAPARDLGPAAPP